MFLSSPVSMDDCLIIGAGLAGLLTAYELSRKGVAVTVIDRRQCGRESSWAGGGILSPLYPWRCNRDITELAKLSFERYPLIISALIQQTGIDPEWTRSGLIILDQSGQQQALVWAQHNNVNIKLMPAEEISKIEPNLVQIPKSALMFPDVAQVRNPRLVQALKKYLVDNGVVIKEHTEVKMLIHNNKCVTGIATINQHIHAGSVVVTCGAWSTGLLDKLALNVKVMPVRGQMLLFKASPDLIRHIILSNDRYLIPRRDGRVLVGSTLEYVGFDNSTTKQTQQDLRDVAIALVPKLNDVEIERHWAGLRPGSVAEAPYIGPHPEVKGLYINTGHFRNGVLLAPGSAQLLVELMLGLKTSVDPTAYAIRR